MVGKSLTRNIVIILCMMSFMSCRSMRYLSTVEKVDLKKYQGTWYEIARLPNSFERGVDCITATYIQKKNGKIRVINQAYNKKKQKVSKAVGTAWRPDEKYQGRLKVSFFWPFAGDYYIIALDDDYQYALVGNPSRKYLWILARNKTISQDTYYKLVKIASKNGFDVSKLIFPEHDCYD